MRDLLTPFVLLLSLAYMSLTIDVAAADSDADVAAFQKIMAGNDAAAKKRALADLANGGDDDARIPALIAASKDRQIGKQALEALRKRTGIKPSGRYHQDSEAPAGNNAAGWDGWWEKKQAAQKKEKELAELTATVKKNEEAALAALEGDDAELTDEEKAAALAVTETTKKKAIPEHIDYGQLDRIFFKNGSLMMCYIVSKQVDLDGNLTSIDIVHRGDAGEESINATLIESVSENVR